MEIKKAGIEDIAIIKNLAETIWPICYKEIISTEQINYMLKIMYSKLSLKEQVEKGHQFIMAYDIDIPVGYASFSQKSEVEPRVFRLHKIYVLPNSSLKGVGTSLLDYLSNECKKLGGTELELNVNKYNTAVFFYKKKNFTIVKEEVLDFGGGYVMDDYVMRCKIDDGR